MTVFKFIFVQCAIKQGVTGISNFLFVKLPPIYLFIYSMNVENFSFWFCFKPVARNIIQLVIHINGRVESKSEFFFSLIKSVALCVCGWYLMYTEMCQNSCTYLCKEIQKVQLHKAILLPITSAAASADGEVNRDHNGRRELPHFVHFIY